MRRSAWGGSLYYLVYFLCGGSYLPFLYVYLADAGMSGTQIGFLAALAPIVTVVLSPFVASVADRIQARVRMTQVAFACGGVTIFVMRFPSTFGTFAWLMLALAVFTTPFGSIADALVGRMALRRGLNYGGMRLWGSLGFAVGALGCGALWQAFGFKTMFPVAGLLFVPAIVTVGLVEEGPVVAAKERRPAWHLLRDRGLLPLLLSAFLSGISNSLAMTFSGIYARALGGGDLLVGAVVAVSALAELPTMFYSDRITARIGGRSAVVTAYAVMAAGFLGYAVVRAPALLPVLSVVKGLGYGLWITVTIRLVMRRTSEEWASTAQALLTMCLFGLASLVAGPVGGLVHDRVGPPAVFVLAAGSLVLAGAVVLLAGGRLQPAAAELGPAREIAS